MVLTSLSTAMSQTSEGVQDHRHAALKSYKKESAESTDVTKGVQSVLKAKQVPHTHHITNRLLLTVKQVISIIQYIAVK